MWCVHFAAVAESEGNQDGKVAASSIPGLNMNKLDSDSFEVMSYVHEGHLWSKDVETEEGVEDEQVCGQCYRHSLTSGIRAIETV